MARKSLWGKNAKFKLPDIGLPKPPKSPKLPGPTIPWDKLGPDPLKWLKIGRK